MFKFFSEFAVAVTKKQTELEDSGHFILEWSLWQKEGARDRFKSKEALTAESNCSRCDTRVVIRATGEGEISQWFGDRFTDYSELSCETIQAYCGILKDTFRGSSETLLTETEKEKRVTQQAPLFKYSLEGKKKS